MSDADFDALMGAINPLTPAEQQEELLAYFAAILADMETADIEAMRDYLVCRFDPCPVLDVLLDVTAGHLALREMKPGE